MQGLVFLIAVAAGWMGWGSSASAAANETFVVDWRCARPERDNLPILKQIEFRISGELDDDKSSRLESPEYDRLLQAARANAVAGRSDNFMCLQRALRSLEKQLFEKCKPIFKKPKSEEVRRYCGRRVTELTTRVRLQQIEIGELAETQQAPVSFRAEAQVPADASAAIDLIVEGLRIYCEKGDGEATDEAFWSNYGLAPYLASPEVVEQRVTKILAAGNPACRKRALEGVLLQLVDQQRPVGWCVNRASECEQIAKATSRALTALQSYFPVPSPEDGAAELASGRIAECYGRSRDPGQFLRDLEMQVRIAGDCVKLDAGESKVVELPDSGGNLQLSYRLTRAAGSKPSFVAELPIDFGKGNADIAAKVKSCYAEINATSALQGPAGEPLKLQLAPRDSKLKPIVFTRAKRATRESGGDGTLTIGLQSSCGTILHESLHLLGLVDEYAETITGYYRNPETGTLTIAEDEYTSPEYTSYNCRALGPEVSIMADSAAAYTSLEMSPSTRLLRPGQFRAITAPGCYAENRVYYRCARFAYFTGRSHGGNGCPKFMPPECANGSKAWLAR